MKTPRWLMGLALLFWGWETGLLWWAALMAAILEGSCWVRARWELADSDLNRICDLCLVLCLGALVLVYSMEDRMAVVFKFTQWLPFCFFPIALAQFYGDRPAMPLSAFSWLVRRFPQSPLSRVSFNISFGYFAICLLAASALTRPDNYFYMGVSVLVFLALGSVRPNRISLPVWLILAATVLLCGEFGHEGLRTLQTRMETALGVWIADLLHSSVDPRECRTSIGRGGRISLSSKIILRVRVPPGEVAPGLLREGAYDSYRRGNWLSGTNQFTQVFLSSNGQARLLAPRDVFSKVDIAGYYPGGAGTLPLPHGTFEIENIPVGVVETNRLGVATLQGGPGMLDLQADYWVGTSMDGAPGDTDTVVPEEEQPVLSALVNQLGLDQMMNDRQKIRAVSRFFQDNFRYSLNVPRTIGRNGLLTPLGQFLTATRAGHCEYFATATVLLLRQAGVCARYITGYAVPDSAKHGDTYVVRERHRHAWALVYDHGSGTWKQIDTTPSSWAAEAEAAAPWWQPGSDFLSNLYFGFSKWRWGKSSVSRYVQWALAPLILFMVWRIISTRRRQQQNADPLARWTLPAWPGLDSELYLIGRQLAGKPLARQPNESLSRWQRRLEEAFPSSPVLGDIFLMHRRLRFDPRGLPGHERERLRRQVEEWLAERKKTDGLKAAG